MLELDLKLVHLQLTQQCNLRCPYCGQPGFRSVDGIGGSNADLKPSVWKQALDSIDAYCTQRNAKPDLCIWGGEPLLYSAFDDLAAYSHKLGFRIGLVTNGILLHEHFDSVKECVNTIYISLDGPKDVHEAARNAPGIFEKVIENVSLLPKTNLRMICLTTITESNFRHLADFPVFLADIGFDKVIFQNLIFATPEDVSLYKKWMADSFDIDAAHIDSWETSAFGDYIHELAEPIKTLEDRIDAGMYPIEVELSPKGITADNIADWYSAEEGINLSARQHDFCYAPFRHLHITANGNVHYCVDFDDFSAGNIKDNDIIEIIMNNKSERFRQDVAQE